jgi:Mrp family chromosome partitioning ATPase
MTPLDQAFIKAYHRGPGRPAIGHAPVGRTSVNRTSAERTPTARPSTAAASVAAVTVSPAHAIPAAHSHFPVAQQVVAAQPVGFAPNTFAPAATFAAPLSTFMSRAPIAPLDPAYQVPNFVWPAKVDELMHRAAAACSTCGAAMLRNSLEQRKVLLVTAAVRGIGCSTVSLILARSAAMRGSRVAIIDLDVRRPRLADMLGVTSPVSWDAGIGAGQPLAESLIESALERLTLMPLTNTVPSTTLPNLADAVNTLREHYDLVLCDAGPAALVSGAPLDDGVIVRNADPASEPLSRRLAALGVGRWQTVQNFAPQG